ncbi:hypothetical protein DFJ74DRAFT_668083 [Hyaloraphidium curvatum]|nr:hypothetical protein DFJ74DRAFT_668083 [Hyaloraphidium curvatum]
MPGIRVLPPALGDGVLPLLSLGVYWLFTTAPAIFDYLGPVLKTGKRKSMPLEKIGKEISAISGGAVTANDASTWAAALHSERWYWKEPPVFLLHNAAAILWGVLSPFQFSAQLRDRFPSLHAWTGRLLLLSLLPASLTGFRLGLNSRIGRAKMAPLGAFMALYVLYQAFAGWAAMRARPRRLFEHRVRMSKLGIFLLGVPLTRPVFVWLLGFADRMPAPRRDLETEGADRMVASLGLSFYITLVGTWLAAEGYGAALVRARDKAIAG